MKKSKLSIAIIILAVVILAVTIFAVDGPENILLAAHSFDADNRPLSTYEYRDIRPIHIIGTMLP